MKLGQPIFKSLFSKAFNLPYLLEPRYRWIDYIKGIATVLVVYRHVLIGIERSGVIVSDYMREANMIFYSFRMPLFFILSGVFISSSLAKRTLKQLIELKFELILYPYLVWAFLQITFQILLSTYTNSNRGLIDYTYIFYQPRSLDQFWYLPALFNVTIIYVLLKKKLNLKIGLQLVLGLLFYYLSMYARSISMMSGWMEFYIFFALGDAFSKVLLKKEMQDKFKSNWFFILITPIFLFTQLYFLKQSELFFYESIIGKSIFIIVSLIGCLFMFTISLRIEQSHVMQFLRIIGAHSLYIYVMHIFLSSFVRLFLIKVCHIDNALLLLTSGIVVCIPVSIMIYNLLIRKGVLWFLFSYKKDGPAVL